MLKPAKLLANGAHSRLLWMLVVPLFVGNEYHGFMGFDECRYHRGWADEDVDPPNHFAGLGRGNQDGMIRSPGQFINPRSHDVRLAWIP